jgi:DNA repair exonuclease SbcCD ATPase subunit
LFARDEKEKRVLELSEQDKSVRYIAQELHMSFASIGSIRRRHLEEKEANSPSVDTQVFTLLEQGKSPVEVAIDMNLRSEEVTRLCSEWWKLKGLHELSQVYEETKNDISEFVGVYKFTKKEGYTPRQVVDAANHLHDLPLLTSRLEQMNKEVQQLKVQRESDLGELHNIRNSLTAANQDLESIKIDICNGKEEIEQLNHKKRHLERLVARTQTSAVYEKLRGIAEASARRLLQDNMMIMKAALGAVIQALKNDPDFQAMISESLKYPTYGVTSSSGRIQDYVILYNAKFLKLAGEIFDNILAKVANDTLSSTSGIAARSG